MRHALLMSEFLSTPWALMPERLNAFVAMLERGTEGALSAMNSSALGEGRAIRDARQAPTPRAAGGAIAVLPVRGIITQRGDLFDALFGPGSTSVQAFTAALRGALGDETVSSILIDVDSPGGSVYGVGELADEIFAARSKKPIAAIANSTAASAAYWIAASASQVYVTPGGEVGSIGVWAAHDDLSKLMDTVGVKRTLISAGKFKTEGNPLGPLSPEAKDFLQSRINDYYGAFTRAVARGRGVPVDSVRRGMGQGRILGADQARAENMVDGIGTFDEVVKRLARGPRGASPAASDLRLPAGASADMRKASPRELRERDL